MTETAFLELKQKVTRLSERERRDLAAYLHKLSQEKSPWKKEAARRLEAMQRGKKVGTAELRKSLGLS